MTVHIIAHCVNRQNFYGTELIFKTFRIGFPSCRAIVHDNCGLHALRPRIEELAKSTGCEYRLNPKPTFHGDLLQMIIEQYPGENVILDSDLIFYESCENFHFDDTILLAGDIFPAIHGIAHVAGNHTKHVFHARVHPSFWWIKDSGEFRNEIPPKSLRPTQQMIEGVLHLHDTGARIFESLQNQNKIAAFEQEHLDCFSHLLFGSHLNIVSVGMDEESRAYFEKIHQMARDGDLEALRGIRAKQLEMLQPLTDQNHSPYLYLFTGQKNG